MKKNVRIDAILRIIVSIKTQAFFPFGRLLGIAVINRENELVALDLSGKMPVNIDKSPPNRHLHGIGKETQG